jgi:hypothetical protein
MLSQGGKTFGMRISDCGFRNPQCVGGEARAVLHAIMTLAEIQKRYQGQWALIEFHQLDANLEVVDGDVLARSAVRRCWRHRGRCVD